MAIVIELLEGKSTQLHRFDVDTITVGRGYDADFYISDPYVSSHHCTLRLKDGQFVIDDHNSLNGVIAEDGTNANEGLLTVAPGSVLRLGKTRVRLLTPEVEVAPAMLLSPLELALDSISSIRVALALALTFAAFVLGRQYLQTYQAFDITAQVRPVLQVLVMFSLWPLLFGLLSRLNKNPSRLSLQFSLVWLFAIGISVFNYVKQWLHFNTGSESLYQGMSIAGNCLAFAGLLWLSLLVAFHQSPRRRNRLAMGITAAMAVISLTWSGLQDKDFTPRPQYQLHLLPPALLLMPAVSTDEFVDTSKGIFERADRLREEAP